MALSQRRPLVIRNLLMLLVVAVIGIQNVAELAQPMFEM